MSDEKVAQIIRQDQIDILVDLTMHMAHNRMLVFARKPAPIQVTYLPYCGTTGLRTIDFRFTDPYLEPQEQHDEYYSERSVRLPETYWCYRPLVQTPQVDALPALQRGYVTFGCLNNFCKVTAPTLDAWRRLMKEVPESRLLVHAKRGSHRDRVRDFLAQERIGPHRLTFVEKVPMAQYFSTYQQMDIALDPFPYGGGTTTCDALWMGVPVVSLAGNTGVGRGALSILSNIGLAELVAGTEDEYVQIAVRLARDLPRLGNLRTTLRERMQKSPLTDAPRLTRYIEAAYRDMWRQWCLCANGGREQPRGQSEPHARVRVEQVGPGAPGAVPEALDRALKRYQAGQWQEAEQLYLQILQVDPNEVDALHLLAVIAGQTGREERAIDYLRKVLCLRPAWAAAHNNLGNVYAAQGKLAEAVAAFQEAVRLQPEFAAAHANLRIALRQHAAGR
jgi:predicted O-linked N-acetylglucosamine transferase (SPINDLY family)